MMDRIEDDGSTEPLEWHRARFIASNIAMMNEMRQGLSEKPVCGRDIELTEAEMGLFP